MELALESPEILVILCVVVILFFLFGLATFVVVKFWEIAGKEMFE